MKADVPRRPGGLLVPLIFTLAVCAVFVGLGTWQLERKAWKEALIARIDARLAAVPEPLAALPTIRRDEDEFRRVRADVTFLDQRPAWLFTGASALRPDVKAPGYFVFVPARLPDGRIVVVNSGYQTRHDPPPMPRHQEIVGYLRWPEPSSWFVGDHDVSGDTWTVRDHLAMAKARGWGEVAPFYIDQEAPVPAVGPAPGPIRVNLPNKHLEYAMTWYALALVSVVMFGFFAWSRRRTA